MQGLISGLALTSGYTVGVLGQWLWNYFELPKPGRRARPVVALTAAGFCFILAAIFLWEASGWQNTLRASMGLEKTAVTRPFVIGVVAVLLFLVLLILARSFRETFHYVSERLHRYVPRRVSYLFGLIAAFAIYGLAANGVLFSLILRAADSSYKQWDRQVQPDLLQPADSMKAGSVASFLKWEEMGHYGREFIAGSVDTSDLKKFTRQPVKQPIRVYVGIHAGDEEERAELALQELKRLNAFDRSVLILATPTGSGWVEEDAIEPVEYLHRGDIATVAAQYSYLPGALPLILEGEYGSEVARALFQKIYGYWTELPRDNRPKLYLQGLSLGALNSDHSFDFFDIINDPFHGALWSGPPFRSSIWREVTTRRRPESPVWLPRFRDDSVVRFANQHGGLEQGEAEWGNFRIAYLQYASDPIVFFDFQAWRREPKWMTGPRGPGVNENLKWYPIVTMLQLVADMIASTSLPPGYGHEYASVDYLQSWMELTEPEGWSEEEFKKLRAHFAQRDERKAQSKIRR